MAISMQTQKKSRHQSHEVSCGKQLQRPPLHCPGSHRVDHNIHIGRKRSSISERLVVQVQWRESLLTPPALTDLTDINHGGKCGWTKVAVAA